MFTQNRDSEPTQKFCDRIDAHFNYLIFTEFPNWEYDVIIT